MMRFIEFLILFFGLLGMSCEAAGGTSTTIDPAILTRRCMALFGIPNCFLQPQVQTTPIPAPSCRCVSAQKCTQNGISTTSYCQSPGQVCCNDPEPESCGYRKYGRIDPRIVTDPVTQADVNTEAEFAEFPWIVAVFHSSNDGSNPVFKCGGTIIHSRAVLTSTHNIRRYKNSHTNLIIRAGEWDINAVNEPINHQDRRVETIILHENFDRTSLNNDVGIIILQTAFDLTPSVGPICLPQGTESIDTTSCITSGWGKDRFDNQGRIQSILKKLTLPVVTNEFCQDRLRTKLGRLYKLHKSFMCAGGVVNQDACTGDGGGPLMCLLEDENRYVQVGIVSWGLECGLDQMPGVYTDVLKARQWIDSKMKRSNLDTSSYVI